MNIRRSHLYVVDFNPRVHTKPGKTRPAAVIQSDLVTGAGYPSTIVIPATSKLIEDAGFMRVRIPKGICGLDKASDLLLGQIIAVANVSFRKHLGPLPADLFAAVVLRLRSILEMPD